MQVNKRGDSEFLFLEHSTQSERKIVENKPIHGSVEINFPLKPHSYGNNYANDQNNSRQNTGDFYKHLLSTVFRLNGFATYDHVEKIDLESGIRYFRPDIHYTEKFGGTHYFEVKSFASSSSKSLSRVAQVENYIWALSNRIAKKDGAPSVDLAFFNYGDRKVLNLAKKNEIDAITLNARKTNSLLVIPLNLALVLYSFSRKQTKAREDGGPDDQYHMVSGHMLKFLQNAREFDLSRMVGEYTAHSLDYAKRKGRQRIMTPMIEDASETATRLSEVSGFGLENLVIERFPSDRKLEMHYKGVRVNPFDVTVYKLKDYGRFTKAFYKNREEITRLMKMKDLYGKMEKERLPF